MLLFFFQLSLWSSSSSSVLSYIRVIDLYYSSMISESISSTFSSLIFNLTTFSSDFYVKKDESTKSSAFTSALFSVLLFFIWLFFFESSGYSEICDFSFIDLVGDLCFEYIDDLFEFLEWFESFEIVRYNDALRLDTFLLFFYCFFIFFCLLRKYFFQW